MHKPIVGKASQAGNKLVVCTRHVPSDSVPNLSKTADQAATIPITEACAIAKPLVCCHKARKR